MTGFGCFQCNLCRFVIAHFANQNNLGRLAQRCPQGRWKIFRVVAHLSLIDSRAFVRVKIFDRIFYRHDMVMFVFIDDVNDRGQRRAFAGSRWPRNQH